MWKCTNCSAVLMLGRVDLEVDSHGLHFVCVVCGHQNLLIDLGGADGATESVQPGDWFWRGSGGSGPRHKKSRRERRPKVPGLPGAD